MIYQLGFYLYLLLLVVLLFRSLYAVVMFYFSIKWLERGYSKLNKEKKFAIVIPVLRESKILKETIQYFMYLKYPTNKFSIYIVSTGKEFETDELFDINTDTVKLAHEMAIEFGPAVKHLHYKKKEGKMVDQLNYAFDVILKDSDISSDCDLFISIYNADSRPNLKTLQYVSGMAEDKKTKVFQQSAIFLQNYNLFRESIEGKLLKMNALLQTRWTLVHEIPRILRQNFFLKKTKKRFFLSHCVGHGLFIRADLLRDLRRIPNNTMTEDLFFGFILSLLGEPIVPIPVLESADMPVSLLSAMKQKYVWFFGPMDHLKYAKYFLKNYKEKASALLVIWFVLQGLLPALAWLFSGWIILYVLVFPLIIGDIITLGISLLVITLYMLGFGLVLKYYTFLNKKWGSCGGKKKRDVLFPGLMLIMIFLHSIPPLFSIYNKFISSITGVMPNKPKTKR